MTNDNKKNKTKEEFKINCIYNEHGECVNKVIQQAFKNFYESKVNN